MHHQRKTLLASIAALALIAGTGLAAAQQSSQSQGTGSSATQQPNATQQMNKDMSGGKTGQNAQSQKMGQSAQSKGAPASQNKTSAGMHHGRTNANQAANESKFGKTAHMTRHGRTTEQRMGQRNAMQEHGRMAGRNGYERHGYERHGYEHGRATAQNRYERYGHGRTSAATAQHNRVGPGRNATAQRGRNGLEGLQGNARANVQLNDQQRTRIRDTVINASGAPRVNSVNFAVAPGTVIPRGMINVVPVPPMLVSIDPAWRGMRYFVYEDEVVIVDPRTLRIIAVLPV